MKEKLQLSIVEQSILILSLHGGGDWERGEGNVIGKYHSLPNIQ